MTLQVNNLLKSFGKTIAVNVPSLSIDSGEIVGVVGNNGAGKTTLFRLILDLVQANSGDVSIQDQNVAESEAWKKTTGSFVDFSFLIDCFTPEEYFSFIGKAYQIGSEEVNNQLVRYEKFLNGEILGKKKYIRDFSSGNKQKTGITGAMLINPQILILDEPFNFLDPSSQIEIKRLIQELNAQCGTTILLSSHNLNHINDVSTRILLMDRSEIRKDLHSVSKETLAELEEFFSIQDE